MAELPDLTVFANILNRKFKGKKLEKIDVVFSKKLNVSAKALSAALEGKNLLEVARAGKTLQLHFSENQVLGLHLMLRGELLLLENEEEKPKFQILSLIFSGSEGFAVTDMQKQATPTLNPDISKVPDALSEEMNLAYFKKMLSKKRTMIKTLLMDQKLIRGIGNSYADEILWHAKVSPFSIANAIPENIVKKLHDSLVTVLKTAITQIAKENGDELKGELRDFMKVHGAGIKESPTGAVVQNEKIGGRKTYFTEEQVLYN